MQKYRAALAGWLLLLPMGADAAACPTERTRYVQAGRTGVTAALAPAGRDGTAASDLVFTVTLKSHPYRFHFQQSNGYGGISLEPIRQPAGAKAQEEMPEIRFIPYRADFTEMDDAPHSNKPAPHLIVLPDLGATLWYDAAALGGPRERETMSRSAFVLAGCGPKKGKPGR
jgi:hypothetical protein